MTTRRVLWLLALATLVGVAMYFVQSRANADAAQKRALGGPVDATPFVADFNRGVVELEQHRFLDAATTYRALVAVRPTNVPAWINLASAELNRNVEAAHAPCLAACAEAERLDPRAPQPPYIRGILQKYTGDATGAEASFRRALALAPGDPTAMYHLAGVLPDGKSAEAVDLLRQALAGQSHLQSAYYALQTQLARAGKPGRAEALAVFSALKEAETGAYAYIVYTELGRLGEAIRDCGVALPAAGSNQVDSRVGARMLANTAEPDGRVLAAIAADDGSTEPTAVIAPPAGGIVLSRGKARRCLPDAPRSITGVVSLVIPADFDQDGKPDLLVVEAGVARLFRRGATSWDEVKLPPTRDVTAATWTDLDQDADLDLVLAHGDGTVTFLINRRDGTFAKYDPAAATTTSAPATSQPASQPAAKFFSPPLPSLGTNGVGATSLCATDLDGDGDADLVFGGPFGLRLWRNDRLMRFVDATQAAGLADAGPVTGFLVEDFNDDRVFDILAMQAGGPITLFTQSTSTPFRMTFTRRPVLTNSPAISAIRVLHAERPGLLVGRAGFIHFVRDAARALAAGATDPLAGTSLTWTGMPVSMAVVEAVADSSREFIISNDHNATQRVTMLDGGPHWLDIRLRGRIEAGKMRANTGGVGARVEVMTGTHAMLRELRASDGMPCAGPLSLGFDMGRTTHADYVRISWPDDVIQSEGPVPTSQVKVIEENQRKSSSCPLVFAWDGTRFDFVTDFLGVGGLGFCLEPGVFAPPDPTERVMIPKLEPKDGRYELLIHEPFEEVCYLDRADLLVVDHPADVTVIADERFAVNAPEPTDTLFAVRERMLPLAATDGRGHDVLAEVIAVDRREASAVPDPRFIGFAEPTTFTFDFGAPLVTEVARGGPAGIVLALDGWVEYPYSHVNLAASQIGLKLEALSVDVEVAGGTWTILAPEACYPAGMPRTMTLPLPKLPAGITGRLRLRTNQELHIDRLSLFRPIDVPLHITRVPPHTATLRTVGYPREFSPDGRAPRLYDRDFMDATMQWKALAGFYTRLGDVRDLLLDADDRYVVFGGGEEIALTYDAPPAVTSGRRRTFILDTFGWCKDMDPHTAHPLTVEPLPFRGMSNYPYAPTEHFPDDAAHRDWKSRFQTRFIPGTRAPR